MEIYRYNPNCKEWEDVRNSKLKGAERENAFKEVVKKIGTKLTLQEYFSIPCRRSDWRKEICYQCIGKPINILEELAFSEIDYHEELSYINAKDRFPEDLIESRTDWEEMKNYADNLAYFIDRLKAEIGNGNVKFTE